MAHGISKQVQNVRYVNSKLKTRPSIESLKLSDGTEAVTNQEKANVLNCHFSNIFDNSNIPLIN